MDFGDSVWQHKGVSGRGLAPHTLERDLMSFLAYTRTTPRTPTITSRTIRTVHINSLPGSKYVEGSDGPGGHSGVPGGGSGGPGCGSSGASRGSKTMFGTDVCNRYHSEQCSELPGRPTDSMFCVIKATTIVQCRYHVRMFGDWFKAVQVCFHMVLGGPEKS